MCQVRSSGCVAAGISSDFRSGNRKNDPFRNIDRVIADSLQIDVSPSLWVFQHVLNQNLPHLGEVAVDDIVMGDDDSGHSRVLPDIGVHTFGDHFDGFRRHIADMAHIF